MNAKPRLSIVFKEHGILSSLMNTFEHEGFEVRTFWNGADALDAFREATDDVAIIGRSMPRMDGPELFRRLRQFSDMPVIFLSSFGEDLADTVPGADDYLATPFSLRLLVNRVRIVLRRQLPASRKSEGLARFQQRHKGLESKRQSCHWGGERVYLNMPERIIFEALGDNGVHTRFALMAAVYGDAVEMDAQLVDEHINSLTRRVRLVDPSFDAIESVFGVAYRLKK